MPSRDPVRDQPFRRIARLRGAALTLAAAAMLAAPAAAQQRPEPVEAAGRVLDRASGRPVAGATVELRRDGRARLTDAEGRFTLTRVRPGAQRLDVSALGYEEAEVEVTVAAGEPLVVQLTPKPLVLAGLRVAVDRLESRRRAFGGSVRALGRDQMHASTAPNLLDFVRDQTALVPVPCPSRRTRGRIPGEPNCVRARGSVRMPAVFVDEMPLAGGLSVLQHYNPRDFEMVEVYGGGAQVRLYSSWYIEQVAKRRNSAPDPIIL